MLEILVRGLGIFLCGILWRVGGDERWAKAWRRYGCSLIIVLVNALFGFRWVLLPSYLLLCASFSLGYGENSTLTKWLKNGYLVRAVCGLLYSASATLILWGNWWALGFHIILTTAFVCIAGNQKFQYSDKREEFGIGIVTSLMPLL